MIERFIVFVLFCFVFIIRFYFIFKKKKIDTETWRQNEAMNKSKENVNIPKKREKWSRVANKAQTLLNPLQI